MTRILIVRHADARPMGESGIETDFERSLTEIGLQQARALANALRDRGFVPDVLVTSPLVRAMQTAEPLRELLNTTAHEVLITERLSPGELRPKKLADEIRDTAGKLVVVVGHNPDLSHFAGWLLGAPEGSIDLKKGAAMSIAFPASLDKADGILEWLITPKWYLAGVAEPA